MSLPTFASWNVRGFNSPIKVNMCKDLIKLYNLKFLAILEAKIQASLAVDPWFAFSHNLFENEKCCDNFNVSSPGRIWVKWDSSLVSFSPTFISSQIIHGVFASGCSPPIIISVIYAGNLQEDRKDLWDNLLMLSSGINLPWVILGDYNCCRFEHEKAGGSPLLQGRLGELNNFIFDCGLQDLSSVGMKYTWFNQRVDLPIHIKLDRILVNSDLLDAYPTAFYKVDPPAGTDHSPLIFKSKSDERTFSRFLFKNYWLNCDEFWEVLLNAFGKPFTASPISAFYNYLGDLKSKIKEKRWPFSNFLSGEILEAKKNQMQNLNDIQTNPLDPRLNASLKDSNKTLSHLQANWASWVTRRSKAYWLSQGEDDLGFLYAKIRSIKNLNNIKEVDSPRGRLSSHHDIADAFVRYFKDLFNAPIVDVRAFSNIPVADKVPSQYLDSLIAPITDLEIKNVIFAGKASSAPGPDGFSFAFYQKIWHIIGYHLCLAVKHFFSSSCMPKRASATAITLIPKGSHSSSMNDYRPISL
ncbi:uncharacterized protein LOC110096766 [Dendrobium catenatum]|uniref:uncharacterized protein LOC110096766 n=1 Tax=Dendrobium catenatum TaxID=906689 RepID=UPI0009F2EF51|nr:uncharacterized protein LOC110096766 [Dendrobium catenatum]